MLTCIDVKFIFDSVRSGLSSSANILQIAASVALRVASWEDTKGLGSLTVSGNGVIFLPTLKNK